MVCEYLGHDGLHGFPSSPENGVSSLSGKVVCHQLSFSSVLELKPLLEVLPPEFPGGGLFRSEDLSVSDGQFRPVEISAVGIEGVPWDLRLGMVVISEQVERVFSEMLLVGKEIQGAGVRIRGWYGLTVGVMNGDDLGFQSEVGGVESGCQVWCHGLVPYLELVRGVIWSPCSSWELGVLVHSAASCSGLVPSPYNLVCLSGVKSWGSVNIAWSGGGVSWFWGLRVEENIVRMVRMVKRTMSRVSSMFVGKELVVLPVDSDEEFY
ncbi:hypothetical protein ARMGADRAFT_1033765 [Armillaria gallica]|uniref:Uncharacterized protein n=1 Tax=Armillaria gallica TaxID=47427 RepID=A0A2H3D0G3_ARMGA|nr:hypothetical protein ARMGADRAFT_1033765 [Armillaria gallica]